MNVAEVQNNEVETIPEAIISGADFGADIIDVGVCFYNVVQATK